MVPAATDGGGDDSGGGEEVAFQTEEGVVIHEGAAHGQKVLYGNVIWDGALSLAKFLAWREQGGSASSAPGSLRGRSCLELGAGTGLVGLTLGRLGASEVLITDNEPEVVDLMLRNIEANSLEASVVARTLDWADLSSFIPYGTRDSRPFDAVVAADVLYDGDGQLFARALAAHMPEGSSTVAYVANHHNPNRCNATLGFLRTMLASGFRASRLEDGSGRAAGSLRVGGGVVGEAVAAAVFNGARFVDLDDLDAVRDARFQFGGESPMECIQIFCFQHQGAKPGVACATSSAGAAQPALRASAL